jgi:tryptophan synthase alpha chain
MCESGVDILELGVPYSDPVMDGPTIQAAATQSLAQGTSASDVFSALKTASDLGIAAVVMTYWNPIERYGAEEFAKAIADNGGSGVITPDLTIEESDRWIAATDKAGINRIYVVAPSTSDARLPQVTDKCGGFVYAASLMGVTGTRAAVSSGAPDLVSRIKKVSKLPIAVGLGVSTREQAKSVAGYADGVIVGSAFINKLFEAPDEKSGLEEVTKLVQQLAKGVREGR